MKEIRRRTRRKFSAEGKIRIVLAGMRGEASIAELCRREGIAAGLYYSWSKEFLDAGKRAWLATRPGSTSGMQYSLYTGYRPVGLFPGRQGRDG